MNETKQVRQAESTHSHATHEKQGVEQQATFADNRDSTTKLLQLASIINVSPRVTAQRQMASMISQSSKMQKFRAQIAPLQRKEEKELGSLQAQFAESSTVQRQEMEVRPNNTGLPDNLKNGIESLSGMSMDHVKVHYNSSQPVQVNAHAYAQGSDIHVAPGQERHLPHEAWHVVQQMQGRVQPTMQMKGGVQINDDSGLEHEADAMGEKALGVGQLAKGKFVEPNGHASQNSGKFSAGPVQRVTEINYTRGAMTYWAGGPWTQNHVVGVGTDALLDPADAKTGSRTAAAPHPSPYTNGNWPVLYQGHLLNANLGGQAIAENLFPVTPAFNGQHSSIVEDHVKAHLLELHDRINDPVTAANFANRRLHYSVQVVNANIAAPFRPTDIGNTVFNCTMEYTQNNGGGPGLGTGQDHALPHFALGINVPPPNDTLNQRLDNLGWGPDAAPSYTLGIHPGGGAAANVRTVLDGVGNTVPNMFIHI